MATFEGLVFSLFTKLRDVGRDIIAFEVLYSIRGTNNELRKRLYKFVHLRLSSVKYRFVHLQLFNVKYKFVQAQLFALKFLFSEKHIFHKQKGTAVCGRASVFSDFKLTRENGDLLSSRHKIFFEVPHPVHEYTIMWILNKRYQTNTVCTL